MKKLFSLIFCLTGILAFAQQPFTPFDLKSHGCSNQMPNPADTVTYFFRNDTLDIRVIRYGHCCSRPKTTITLVMDTLNLSIQDTATIICACDCPYEYKYSLYGMEKSKYALKYNNKFYNVSRFPQAWPTVGAKWYFDESFAAGHKDFILFTVEKDTIIKGQECRKLSKRHDLNCNSRPKNEYLYSQNDSVFFYDPILDAFQLLYNFKAVKNSFWSFKFIDEPYSNDTVKIIITVDSISSMQTNARTLRVLHVSYQNTRKTYPQNYKSHIIEGIGDIAYLFNYKPSSACLCDDNYTSGLRCYEDNTIGNYQFPSMDSCTYSHVWVGIESYEPGKIKMYPNPVFDFVQITGTEPGTSYEILDITGVKVRLGKVLNTSVNMQNVAPGFYFICLFNAEGQLVSNKKIIKSTAY